MLAASAGGLWATDETVRVTFPDEHKVSGTFETVTKSCLGGGSYTMHFDLEWCGAPHRPQIAWTLRDYSVKSWGEEAGPEPIGDRALERLLDQTIYFELSQSGINFAEDMPLGDGIEQLVSLIELDELLIGNLFPLCLVFDRELRYGQHELCLDGDGSEQVSYTLRPIDRGLIELCVGSELRMLVNPANALEFTSQSTLDLGWFTQTMSLSTL